MLCSLTLYNEILIKHSGGMLLTLKLLLLKFEKNRHDWSVFERNILLTKQDQKMDKFEINPYTKVFLMRLVMFLVYLNGGALVFMWIENGNDNSSHFNDSVLLLEEIRQNATNTFNISHDQFQDLVQKILQTASMKPTKPWSYLHSLMYTMHLLTTIGEVIM